MDKREYVVILSLVDIATLSHSTPVTWCCEKNRHPEGATATEGSSNDVSIAVTGQTRPNGSDASGRSFGRCRSLRMTQKAQEFSF